MSTRFGGVGVALITPFHTDLSIDYPSLEKLIDWHIAGGVDYIVALGTTAETATLTHEEQQSLIHFISRKIAGRVPMVIGIGSNDTRGLLEKIQSFDLTGADAILSVVPYYSKPTQEGIFQHYMAITKVTQLPVLLYNVPSRSGVSMSAETTLRLARASEQFAGTKEASGNLAEISKILRDKPDHFTVLSGDDALTVPMIALGAEGVISVVANVAPKSLSKMTHAALQGRYSEAAQMHLSLTTLTEALFWDGNPAGAKAALSVVGRVENVLRLPLVPVSEKTHKTLASEIVRFE